MGINLLPYILPYGFRRNDLVLNLAVLRGEEMIIFSQRVAIAKLFERRCKRERMLNCIENFLIYANDKRWLNEKKINKQVIGKRIAKILGH